MTAIVGLIHGDRVYMGADSRSVRDWDQTPLIAPKIHRIGPYVLGTCGSLRSLQLVQYAFRPVEPSGDLTAFLATVFVADLQATLKNGGYATTVNDQEFNTDSMVMVGVHGRLFTIDAGYAVTESARSYAAMGSGEDLALGAMYVTDGQAPKHRIRQALSAAAEFNAGVGEPFTILSVRY